MRTMTILFAVLLALSCKQPSKKSASVKMEFNEAAEKAAIMETIENETETFYKRDYEGWKANFIQEAYAFQGWSNADGTFDAQVGWNAVDERTGRYIKNNPVAAGKSNHPLVERRNLVLKFFSENLAYLVWDQYNSDQQGKSFTLSKDQRIMEKINGKWKIANVSAYWDYKNIISADSLNNL